MKIGVSANFCGFLVEREKNRQKHDNWNFWFWFFVQKWPFRDAHLFFSKMLSWNPYFYSVFWVRVFFGQVVKKENVWTPTQKRKNWLITEKLFSWYFCVLCCFFVFCFEVLRVRPPHLALNPPYLFFVFLPFLLFSCFFFPFFASHWKTDFSP